MLRNSLTTSADTANLEAMLDTVVRLDREVEALRACNVELRAVVMAQQTRMANFDDYADCSRASVPQ